MKFMLKKWWLEAKTVYYSWKTKNSFDKYVLDDMEYAKCKEELKNHCEGTFGFYFE